MEKLIVHAKEQKCNLIISAKTFSKLKFNNMEIDKTSLSNNMIYALSLIYFKKLTTEIIFSLCVQ